MNTMKNCILLVDDEPAAAQLVQEILSESGVEVLMAPSAEKALTILEGRTPDLVLVDVIMPGISGYEFVDILRADDRWSSIPILLISGKTFPTSGQSQTGQTANGFLKKPFSKKELFAAVGRFIQVDYSL